MEKQRKDSDFHIDLDGVGRFWFARRTLGHGTAIMVERSRLLGGAAPSEVDPETSGVVNVLATLQVLCVSAPPGWGDFKKIDVLENPGVLDQMFDLFVKLSEKEDSFRGAAKSRGTQAGAGNSGDTSVLVPEKIQPAA